MPYFRNNNVMINYGNYPNDFTTTMFTVPKIHLIINEEHI